MLNKEIFFDKIRDYIPLTNQNVEGFDRVLDYADTQPMNLQELAYVLATAYHESANTMHPVKEAYWLSEDWRRQHLHYYPWYGRGLIQVTWEENYKKMGDRIGVNLLADPDALLTWDVSLPSLFVGMREGLYTGKDLDDAIDDIDESDDEDYKEYKAARKIVNGTDKADTIAKLAIRFEMGLKAAGWTQGVAPPDMPEPPTPPPSVPAEKPAGVPWATYLFWAIVLGVMLAVIALIFL